MPVDHDADFILRQVDEYYSDKVRTHGPTPRGVDWNSSETQELRFRQISSILPNAGFSISDLGCGYGGYYDYLQLEHDEFDYVGVDISEEMIRQAIASHNEQPNCRFICADRPNETTDFVVASGVFNVRQSVDDATWLRYIHNCLDIMNTNSNRGFSFNFLTLYSDEDRKRDYLYYADPVKMLRHCMGYSRHVTLLHGYGLYEFTILVRKDSPI